MSGTISTSLQSPTRSAGNAAEPRPGTELQRLIDGDASGHVQLPAGHYRLDDSLRLRSQLTITTAGPVVLTRGPVIESLLSDVVGYGHREFRPVDPTLFRVGMGVALSDRRGGGFGTTVARIVGEKNGWFYTDTPADRDFRPADGACVRSVFPMIAGYGVRQVSVEGLSIEGDGGATCLLDGCRDAGVYLIGCRDVRLSRLGVAGYPGDAVSFQQCIDITVQDCRLHHNAGHGLHPGSGSVRYVMRRNHVHDNGGCGIFYCLRTTHSVCQENDLAGNAAEGISVGERDTDHLIESNQIRANGSAGIRLRRRVASGADRLVIRRNLLDGNGLADGSPELELVGGVRWIHIEGNHFAGEPAVAVRVGEGCEQVVVAGNLLAGGALPASAVETKGGVQSEAAANLDVGPAFLPADGARHLGVVELGPWVNPCD
jgi:hypothetical protein